MCLLGWMMFVGVCYNTTSPVPYLVSLTLFGVKHPFDSVLLNMFYKVCHPTVVTVGLLSCWFSVGQVSVTDVTACVKIHLLQYKRAGMTK